jgi:hypothetical protein
MLLFMSEVEGPESADQFTDGYYSELFPALARRNVAATPWVEVDAATPEWAEWRDEPRRFNFLIQGWTDETLTPALADITGRLGWQTRARVFAALDPPVGLSLGLPDPRRQVVLCAMPHNAHHVNPRKAKLCPRGHYFSKDHAIANCAACGSPLP